MTITAIRKRLHGYIDNADDKQIKNIYALFEDQMAPVSDWSEDEELVAELDERMRRYEQGIDKPLTWDDLEATIAGLKNDRVAK